MFAFYLTIFFDSIGFDVLNFLLHMKVLRTVLTSFLFFVILTPLASADSTAKMIMQLYNTNQKSLTEPQTMRSAAPRRISTVDFRYRIPRTSDPSSVRRGEVVPLSNRRAQDVYTQQKATVNAQQEQSEDKLQTRRDNLTQTVRRPALSPWFSLNWKNRLRAGYNANTEEQIQYRKPEIEAKRQVTPFNTYNRGRYNYQDSELDGRRKLIRTRTTRSPWDYRNSTRPYNYWGDR